MAFTKHPFVFIWPSLVYLALQFLFILAAVGLFLIYFIVASVLNVDTSIQAIPTIVAVSAVILIFLFFSCGLNAGLMKGYTNALENKKTTLADLFKYSIAKSPIMFTIMLIRDLIWLFVAGWVVGAFVYFDLGQYEFADILVGTYVFFATFFVHLVFTPGFLSAGSQGVSLFQSMRNGFHLLRSKHIMFVGLYILFAMLWILGFIPIIQLMVLFVLYPIVYAAMISMLLDYTR